jgi:hypothetical protein
LVQNRESVWTSGLEIIASEFVLYHDAVGIPPVLLPQPTVLGAKRILFYVIRSTLS